MKAGVVFAVFQRYSLPCLLFLISTASSVSALRITSSLEELNFHKQETLRITCVCNSTLFETELASVEIIRVQHHSKRGWTNLAQLSVDHLHFQNATGLRVTGKLGPTIKDTFLHLVWEKPSPEELGAYRCNLVGTDKENDYVVEKSNVLLMVEHNSTVKELLDLSQGQIDILQAEFDKFKKKTVKEMALLQKSVRELSQKQENSSETSGDEIPDSLLKQVKKEIQENILANVSDQVQNLTCSRLRQCLYANDSDDGMVDRWINLTNLSGGELPRTNKTDPSGGELHSRNNTNATALATQNSTDSVTPGPEKGIKLTNLSNDKRSLVSWPSGEFGLLKAESGCPGTSVNEDWQTGYVKYHTESVDDNHDQVSTPNHLAKPITETDSQGNHFMYMHFCVHRSISKKQLWPAGSYCINQKGMLCPVGFHSGFLDIDEEDTNFAGVNKGTLPNMLFYCCRNDGPADQPMVLPDSWPFYLYRFGGTCQKVQNMQVASESMTFDTENVNNEDGYQNQYHPDGQLRDVKIEVCYYS